jgi:(2R)-ethylmalonyl-CoA mutase
MRTYSGHSSAAASNRLYRSNLAKGQTGLSVAFDLPTQTGYDADHVLARGEVGKVGVPVSTIDDLRALFDGIPLAEMNTSMTINATAAWLLSLYVVVAREQGVAPAALAGTTQNDIIKEYLSRGTYVFPPGPSMRLISDMVVHTVRELPRWNPVNVCSYHLQEVGATPVQEIAYALATATAVLDRVRASGQVPPERFAEVVGRISFFVNAGIRFVEEIAKLRAFAALWNETCRDRYGVTDERHRRFRYGVQVNSLGLTESQPENNITRIVLEMLAVTLSRDVRARAVQLPAWNEALGLPRPWDQQLSLRMQQVLGYETDLLEHGDLFEGSRVMAELQATLAEGGREEYRKVLDLGGAVEAVAYMKGELVRSNAERLRRIEAGEQVVVGVNRFPETEPSPLAGGLDGGVLTIDPASEAEQVSRLQAFRATRDRRAVERALAGLRSAAASEDNIMAASIAAAEAGRHDRGVDRRAARGLRRVPRADRRRRAGRRGRDRRDRAGTGQRAGRGGTGGREDPPADRQARARRALVGRGAGRRQSTRRRLRGDLRGHPSHAGADRPGRRGRGRPRGRPVGAVRVARHARARDHRGAAPRGPVLAGRRGWHHPVGGCRGAPRRRRRRGLHAEGLRALPARRGDRGPRRADRRLGSAGRVAAPPAGLNRSGGHAGRPAQPVG